MPERDYENAAISPDGKRAVVQIREGITALWIYEFGRNALTPIGSSEGSSQSPVWTADGARVIYRGTRAGFRNVYWRPADGSGSEERLTTKPGRVAVARRPRHPTATGSCSTRTACRNPVASASG